MEKDKTLQLDLVSIMMPTYNMAAYIDQAIQSVFRQKYAHWELVIVDDGSTDATADVLAAVTDPRIHVIHQPNGGEGNARNTALEHISGEFLAFLDADDVYHPDHLANAVQLLRSHPEVDGVYSDGEYIDPQGNVLYTLASRRRGPFEGDIFEQVIRASDVFGPPGCVVVRTSKVGSRRFDESIRTLGTDWDFWARYTEHTCFAYSPQKTYSYRTHPTNLTSSVKKDRLRLDTAICREKAIHMSRFAQCSLAVREFLFYDLLVNLLPPDEERQNKVLAWPEFQSLPDRSQARLLRLMASQALMSNPLSAQVRPWLERAARSNPADPRARGLLALHRLNPGWCRSVLALRRS